MPGRLSVPVPVPFASIEGMEDAKKALLCALVSPHLRTVLIQGTSGTAKTALARGVVGLEPGKRLVNIPLGISVDDLLGGLDIEYAVKDGGIRVRKGLLAESHGNMAYIDDINLMDDRLTATVLESVTQGSVAIERDGISESYECDTLLIATMNPDEGTLSQHMLDRFDLCAFSDYPDSNEGRIAVARKSLDRIADPKGFVKSYAKAQKELVDKIARAREIIGLVTVSDNMVEIINELCDRVGAHGMRGNLAMVNASKALAALDSRDYVIISDVEEAAAICLPHRRTVSLKEMEQESQQQEQTQDNEKDGDEEQEMPETPPEAPAVKGEEDDSGDDSQPPPDGGSGNDPGDQKSVNEILFDIGRQFRVIDFLDRESGPKKSKSNMGRRGFIDSDDTTGKHYSSRTPDGRPEDIDICATIKAAAQSGRRGNGNLAIRIEKEDLREKVREKRIGSTILFVVDASGSLGVRKRMTAVKGAILSMLKDSYVKRDRVGMMVFRRYDAEMVIPPTKSFEYGYRKLEEMRTGGGTPIGEALVKSYEFMSAYAKSHSGERCFVILMTDGRANVAYEKGAHPEVELMNISRNLAKANFDWIVIDAERGPPTFGNSMVLARDLGAAYLKLEQLDADALKRSIENITHNSA